MNTVFKKYYCPNCGVHEFSFWQKIFWGSGKQLGTSKCTFCHNDIQFNFHPVAWVAEVFFLLSVIFLFLDFILLIQIIVFFFCLVNLWIVSLLFCKFDRATDYQYQDKTLMCKIDLNDEIKSPRMYFHRTAVVMLDFEKIDYFVPAWIEPIKINEKHCECKVAFIGDDDIDDFKDKPFIVSDNYVEVGTGEFVV